jgi:hypothetical protein
LAILKLAQGDLQKFKQELRTANIDWRDTLVGAGMAYGDERDWMWLLREEGEEIE